MTTNYNYLQWLTHYWKHLDVWASQKPATATFLSLARIIAYSSSILTEVWERDYLASSATISETGNEIDGIWEGLLNWPTHSSSWKSQSQSSPQVKWAYICDGLTVIFFFNFMMVGKLYAFNRNQILTFDFFPGQWRAVRYCRDGGQWQQTATPTDQARDHKGQQLILYSVLGG